MASSSPTRRLSTTTLITDTIDGLTPDHPVFEDPGSFGYYREEAAG